MNIQSKVPKNLLTNFKSQPIYMILTLKVIMLDYIFKQLLSQLYILCMFLSLTFLIIIIKFQTLLYFILLNFNQSPQNKAKMQDSSSRKLQISYHRFSFVLFSIILFLLPTPSRFQAMPTYNVPQQGLQTKAVVLILDGSLTHGQSRSNITYVSPFSTTPSIVLGLSGLNSLDGQIKLYQQATSRTSYYFTHKLTLTSSLNSIKFLKITYLAVNLIKFNYIYPHSFSIQPQFLSISDNPDSEYFQVQYLNPINANSRYAIGVVLTGFWINSNAFTWIGVEAQFYTISDYLVKLTVRNGTMANAQVSRILMDQTLQSSQTFTQYYTTAYIGTIIQSALYQTRYRPQKIDFYSQAKFFGIIYFQNGFNFIGSQISVSPTPPVDVTITFVIFMQYLCPSSYPMYEPITMTCYSDCSIRLYQADLTTCGLCYGACYQCTGPLIGDCTKYLPQQAQNITTDIICKIQYSTNSLTRACKSCESYVPGCVRCLSDGSCTSCKTKCSLVSPTYCDCSFFCLDPKIVSPITSECICRPQYYEAVNGTCLPCQRGCYMCSGSAINCSVCIDRYQLYHSSCILFQHSTYLIDLNNGFISSTSRCIQKIEDTCKTYCDDTSLLYKFKCFMYSCPAQTFGFIDIYGGGMCQLCSDNCLDCDNYFVCKDCESDGYFMNSTGQCVTCLPGCKGCANSTSCAECRSGYRLVLNGNGGAYCFEIIPFQASTCGQGCKKCVVSTFCEQCQLGFTRMSGSYTCQKCEGSGFVVNYTNLVIQNNQVIKYLCKEVCGDGLLYIDECDDKNKVSGDGCSEDCKIQEGYNCEYLTNSKMSFCLLYDYSFDFRMKKNLTSNQLNITLFWTNGTSVYFNFSCPNSMTFLSYSLTNSSCTYTFSYSASVQNQTCTFSLPQSSYLEPLTCNMSTNPSALYFNTDHFLLKYSQLAFFYVAKPLAYLTWIIFILGIDPFTMLINHSFIYLYLTSLYEFSSQPSSVYGIFSQLKFFAFDEINIDNTEVLTLDGLKFVQASYKILILLAVSIGFQEIVVRFLKTNLFFADCQSKIFQNMFRNRFINYICIFGSLQPIITIYITSILIQTNQMELNQDIVGFFVAALHLLFSFASIVLILISFNGITSNKYHVKYLFFICLMKWLSLVGLIIHYFFQEVMYVSPVIFASTLSIFLIFVLADCSSDQIFINSKHSDELSSQSSRSIQLNTSNNWTQIKSIIRKINTFIQLSAFIGIYIMRILYIQNFKQLSSYEFYGIIINILFIISLFSGFILQLIQIVLTLGIFLSGELEFDPNSKSEKKSANQSEFRSQQREDGNGGNADEQIGEPQRSVDNSMSQFSQFNFSQ